MDSLTAFKKSQALIHPLMCKVGEDVFDNQTPCSEWNVKALINHIINELSWMPDLLAGKTIAEVGDKYDGDLVGDEPHKNWELASRASLKVWQDPDSMQKIVHLSYGDVSGEAYLNEMTIDAAIHAWDLAVGMGEELELPEDLAEFCLQILAPQADEWRESGSFGPEQETPDDATISQKLIALSGRKV